MSRMYVYLLMLSCFKTSMATSIGNSTLTGNVYDYIARTFPELCPYEPLCYQTARKTATDTVGSCCLPCSCRDHCHLLSNCCPDKRLGTEDSTRGNVLLADMFECTASELFLRGRAKHYHMVNKCPLPTTTQALSMDCESTDDTRPSALIPVTDLDTGITYKNTYCSQCHGVSRGVSWSISLQCAMTVLQSIDYGEFSSIASLLSGFCSVYFSPPKETNVEIDRCYPITYDTCNKTRQWKPDVPSELMIEACESWRAAYSSVYGNVYCAICNEMYIYDVVTCRNSGKAPVTRGSFIATLKYRSDPPEEDTERGNDEDALCPVGFVMDPYMETCRRIVCPQFKRLVNGQCEKMLTNYDNLKLQMLLKLVTTDIKFFEKESVNSKKGAARKYLKFLTNDRQDLKISLRDVAETAEDFHGTPYLAVLATVSIQSVPDPDILQWIYDRLNLPFTYTTQADQSFVFKVSMNARVQLTFLDYGLKWFATELAPALIDLAANSTLVSLYHRQVVPTEEFGMFFSRLFFCQQIQLNQSEYEDNNGLSIVVLAPNTTMYTFDFMKNRRTSETRVCVQDYLPEPLPGRHAADPSNFIAGLVYAMSLIGAFCLVIGALAAALYRHRRLSQLPPAPS